MTEIYDFWGALWHDAWASWDGLWLFQVSRRPIDRILAADREKPPAPVARQRRVARLRTDLASILRPSG